MNNKDNLQESFKKAFENHNEPLLNHQWERLSLDLKNQKKKSIFSFWNMMIALSLVFLGSLIGFYIKPNQQNIQLTKTEESSQFINEKLASEHSNSLDQVELETFKNENKIQNSKNEIQNNQINKITPSKPINSIAIQANNQIKSIDSETKQSIPHSFLNSDNNKKDSESIENTNETTNDKGKEANNDNDNKTNNNEKAESDKKETIEKLASTDEKEAKDSVAKVVSKSKPQPKAIPNRNKMAVFVSYGFSNIKTANTTISNDANLHKDGLNLFNQSEKGKESRLLNVGIEFYIKKNLNIVLQTGTQYREVNNTEAIDYSYKEIPFRNVDGSIIGYFNDTFNPLRIVGSNVLKRRYVTIPIQFAYIFPIHLKHELQPSFGLNINKLVSASGNTFSVNDGETKPLSSVLSKKINIGMMAGLQYNYNIRQCWWLGAAAIWQQNIQNNDLGYNSSVKSKINQYNYNLILKYKF